MTGSAFNVSVVECKAVRVIGVKITANMANAHQECSRLWGDFMPRMREIQLDGEIRSYGVSVMLGADADKFEYWAAIPSPASAPVPDGMAETVLPAGLYAECWISGLEQLSDCYNYIYSTWLPASTGYEMVTAHPGYELYLPDFEKTGRLGVYCPIRKK